MLISDKLRSNIAINIRSKLISNLFSFFRGYLLFFWYLHGCFLCLHRLCICCWFSQSSVMQHLWLYLAFYFLLDHKLLLLFLVILECICCLLFCGAKKFLPLLTAYIFAHYFLPAINSHSLNINSINEFNQRCHFTCLYQFICVYHNQSQVVMSCGFDQ